MSKIKIFSLFLFAILFTGCFSKKYTPKTKPCDCPNFDSPRNKHSGLIDKSNKPFHHNLVIFS